jgi:hypothetical protein
MAALRYTGVHANTGAKKEDVDGRVDHLQEWAGQSG